MINSFRSLVEGVHSRRQWYGYDVDVELKDKWLEALNSMDFDLISICYGHPEDRNDNTGGGSKYAHINIAFTAHNAKMGKEVEEKVLEIQRLKFPNTKIQTNCWLNKGASVHIQNGKDRRGEHIFPQEYWDDYDSGKTWTGRASVSFTHTTPTDGNEEKTDKWFDTMCQKLGTL